MACRFAIFDADAARYQCVETGDGCFFLNPNETTCYERYQDGPLAFDNEDLQRELEEGRAALGKYKCCLCPGAVCPGIKGSSHPRPTPCRLLPCSSEIIDEMEGRDPAPISLDVLTRMDGKPIFAVNISGGGAWGIVKVDIYGEQKGRPFLVGHIGFNFEWDIEKLKLTCYPHKPDSCTRELLAEVRAGERTSR